MDFYKVRVGQTVDTKDIKAAAETVVKLDEGLAAQLRDQVDASDEQGRLLLPELVTARLHERVSLVTMASDRITGQIANVDVITPPHDRETERSRLQRLLDRITRILEAEQAAAATPSEPAAPEEPPPPPAPVTES